MEQSIKEILEQIRDACGTVNFSSHTQMKEALIASLELAETGLEKISNIPAEKKRGFFSSWFD